MANTNQDVKSKFFKTLVLPKQDQAVVDLIYSDGWDAPIAYEMNNIKIDESISNMDIRKFGEYGNKKIKIYTGSYTRF